MGMHLQYCPVLVLCVPLQPELLPVMAVGTSGGATFLISPDTMTVYAKLRCAPLRCAADKHCWSCICFAPRCWCLHAIAVCAKLRCARLCCRQL